MGSRLVLKLLNEKKKHEEELQGEVRSTCTIMYSMYISSFCFVFYVYMRVDLGQG